MRIIEKVMEKCSIKIYDPELSSTKTNKIQNLIKNYFTKIELIHTFDSPGNETSICNESSSISVFVNFSSFSTKCATIHVNNLLTSPSDSWLFPRLRETNFKLIYI